MRCHMSLPDTYPQLDFVALDWITWKATRRVGAEFDGERTAAAFHSSLRRNHFAFDGCLLREQGSATSAVR
jgi:hypothetical protein